MSCTLLDRKPLLGAILLGLTGTMVYRRSGGLGETRPTCVPYLEALPRSPTDRADVLCRQAETRQRACLGLPASSRDPSKQSEPVF